MKAYTDLEQSRKLEKILPLESADMFYYKDAVTKEDNPRIMNYMQVPKNKSMYYTPCWSLAALLSIIPKRIKDFNVLRIDIYEKNFTIWYDGIGFGVNSDLLNITTESAIDACVEMILKLHELNLL